ncbi:MAG: alpha/beta hydrolase [Oscillospiraceae bacterium]|nr:alpha/beta hydrolase [Oscillospiraceae bacterium]
MVDALLRSLAGKVAVQWAKSDQKVVEQQILPQGVREETALSYGTDPAQQLDLYAPNDSTGPLPVLLHFHGGGFFYGDKSLDRAFSFAMAKRGFLVINCNYRLTNQTVRVWHQLQDCADGARWLSSHLAQYNGDQQRVFLSGGSAGAVFAVLLALLEREPDLRRRYKTQPAGLTYRGILSNCGFYAFYHKKLAFRCQRRICFGKGWRDHPLYQGMLWQNLPGLAKLPPVFLLTGHDDWLRGMTLTFDRLLTQNGVPHKLLELPRGREDKLSHLIAAMRPDLPACRMALDSAAQYLLTQVSEHPAAMEKRIQQGSHF